MARMQTYPSRGQQQHAVQQVTEILRKAGHNERPEGLVTTMQTDGNRQHGVAVAVEKGTALAGRIATALALADKVDAATLLTRAAKLLRDHEPDRWLDHYGDGSIHGVHIGKLLRSAWAQLGGNLDVEPEDLPGADTLAGVLLNLPPNTDRVSISYAFTEWTLRTYNNAEQTLERVEIAVEAATDEGRGRRERAGCLMALREPKLREATRALREQVHADESEYDDATLLDAASNLLDQVDELLDALKTRQQTEAP